MDYKNSTPFPSLAFEALDAQGAEFHVVVLRMTLAIEPDGSLVVAPNQSPLMFVDEFYGELNKSSVKQESDLAPYKPWCDVIVIGDASAPGGKAVQRFEAGVRLSRKGNVVVNKRLAITGPRCWQKRLLFGWKLTKPELIRSLPLRYEYAYGGECRVESNDSAVQRIDEKYRLTVGQRTQHPDGVEKAPAAHVCAETNPVGTGYAENWYLKAKKLKRIPAPQIESPQDPIVKFGKSYSPQGLGVIGRAWASRRALCGTLNDAFTRSGGPLPEDFDFAYWNGAHPDLQVPWLEGDETIDLINIPVPGLFDRPDSQGDKITRLSLPGYNVCALALFGDGTMVDVDFNLDTLSIDTTQKTVNLLYRLKRPVTPEIQSLEVRQPSAVERSILAEHVQAVNKQVLHYQEAPQ
jgi:hypothetical protein